MVQSGVTRLVVSSWWNQIGASSYFNPLPLTRARSLKHYSGDWMELSFCFKIPVDSGGWQDSPTESSSLLLGGIYSVAEASQPV